MNPVHTLRSKLLIVVLLPLCLITAALEAAYWAVRDELTDARNQWKNLS